MIKTYATLKAKIEKLIGVTIQPHTVIDQIIYGTSHAIDEAHNEIEANKTPHIYSGMRGERIDGIGMLIGCARYENESDNDYLTRVMAHHTANQASNTTAILMALTNLTYTSHVSYTPFTQGVGTATIHFIPKHYDNVDLAKQEISKRLEKVVSPDAYLIIQEATPISVEITAYCVFEQEVDTTSQQIREAIRQYVNNIPIGESISYSAINKIALSIEHVSHFNTIAIFIDKKRMHALETLQTIEKKFIFEQIHFQVTQN